MAESPDNPQSRARISGRYRAPGSRTSLGYARRPHILTVALEDYYHTSAHGGVVERANWYRYESRLETGTLRALDLLDQFGAKATFFALGWVADAAPEVLRLIAERGHEIATLGYYHRNLREMTRQEFRLDLTRARDAIEEAIGQRIVGFRMADGRLQPQDLWLFPLLQDLGFSYDSSLQPLFREWTHAPIRRFVQRQRLPGPEFWEVPFSSLHTLGLDLPISGGNYVRQLPPWLMRRAMTRWMRLYRAPFVMYFHTWELDPDQPHLAGVSRLRQIRQHRHLDRMPELLAYYLSTYKFTSVAEYLKIERARLAEQDPRPRISREHLIPETVPRVAVTIVVSCYNAELQLPRLVETIQGCRLALARRYDLRAILIDDASTDNTFAVMSSLFAWDEGARCFHQPHHLGTAATILRGIRDADTDIVCSIDADCRFDPHQLVELLPLLTDDVDVVVGSAYHPQGTVKNVPLWERALIRTGEFCYRRVFRTKLHGYGSVFRLYRKSALEEVAVREGGSVGVVEMLAQLELNGARIVEHPVVLEGQEPKSPQIHMLRAALGHVKVLARHLGRRMFYRP